MRLIDADELLKKIDENFVHVKDDLDHGFNSGLYRCQYIAEEQPTVEQDNWIPCGERLPENQPSYISGTDYYVTLCSGVVRSAKYKERKWIGAFGKVYSDNEVIAWQEDNIPEPYKG